MLETGLEARILEAVQPFGEVSLLAVFGSRARGAHRQSSDLDVALLCPSADPGVRRRLQAQLAGALGDLVPSGRADVVFLDEASDVLCQRVMESAKVLFCRDPKAWCELRVATMREYGDREWVRRLMREKQRERLERGQASGRSGRALRSLERAGRVSR